MSALSPLAVWPVSVVAGACARTAAREWARPLGKIYATGRVGSSIGPVLRVGGMLTEPRSGRLVAWGNAQLAGLVSPDDAVVAVVGEDAVHRVEGLPGEPAPVGLTLALGRLRGL